VRFGSVGSVSRAVQSCEVLEIENDRSVRYWQCETCRNHHTNVHGAILRDGTAWALYWATCGHSGIAILLDVTLGKWTESDDDAGFSHNVTFGARTVQADGEGLG
jgi:hypothetical protein